MRLTEADARETWCPFARFGDNANNRWRQHAPEDRPYAVNPVPCRCIATDCMAWRWADGDRGYCGLAGKPE